MNPEPVFTFEESMDGCLLLSGRCQLSWPRLDGKPGRADCSAFARALREVRRDMKARGQVGDSAATAPWENPTAASHAIHAAIAARPDAFGQFAVAALADLRKSRPELVQAIRAAVPVPDETSLADLARENPELAFNLVHAVLADGSRA